MSSLNLKNFRFLQNFQDSQWDLTIFDQNTLLETKNDQSDSEMTFPKFFIDISKRTKKNNFGSKLYFYLDRVAFFEQAIKVASTTKRRSSVDKSSVTSKLLSMITFFSKLFFSKFSFFMKKYFTAEITFF